MKRWLCLIGLRCSGKTTVGQSLSAELKWDFCDTDQMLIKQQNLNISQLLAIYGEARFRMLETQCLFSLPKTFLVLSSGGGIVENPEALAYLKGRAIFVYLDVSTEILIQRRLKDPGDRPLLFGASSISEEYYIAMTRRKALLESTADYKISINGSENVSEICELIRRACGIQ